VRGMHDQQLPVPVLCGVISVVTGFMVSGARDALSAAAGTCVG
jgi:hypothetical protein